MALLGTIRTVEVENSSALMLCFMFESADWNKPQLIRNYFLIQHGSRRDLEAYDGRTAIADGSRVELVPLRPFGLREVLVMDAAAKAVKTELIEIPAPKVRKGIETRWKNGRWQKCLRSAGWVNV